MSKHIASSHFYNLPSGSKVHPCRLIHKDGTLMWKHALLYDNVPWIPKSEYQEQHIIKTAQRLEELNSWVSHDCEPWECLRPIAWFYPYEDELKDGISVHFLHSLTKPESVYTTLKSHILAHESLELRQNYLYFRRC